MTTTKENYIKCRTAWKTNYKQLTTDIRELKLLWKTFQRTFSKVSMKEEYLLWNDRYLYLPQFAIYNEELLTENETFMKLYIKHSNPSKRPVNYVFENRYYIVNKLLSNSIKAREEMDKLTAEKENYKKTIQ